MPRQGIGNGMIGRRIELGCLAFRRRIGFVGKEKNVIASTQDKVGSDQPLTKCAEMVAALIRDTEPRESLCRKGDR